MDNNTIYALYEFIVDNDIATSSEVELVTDINGYTEDTMNDIIYVRTGNHNYEQCIQEGFFSSKELDDYYQLNEEEEED